MGPWPLKSLARLWRAGDVDVNSLSLSPLKKRVDSDFEWESVDVDLTAGNCAASDLYNTASVVSDPDYSDETKSSITNRIRVHIVNAIEVSADGVRISVSVIPHVFYQTCRYRLGPAFPTNIAHS